MTPSNDSHSNKWVKKKIEENQYPDEFSQSEKDIHDELLKHSASLEVDTEKGWNIVHKSILTSSNSISKSNMNRQLMRLAAAITLLIVAGIAIFNFIEVSQSNQIHQSGLSKQMIQLADGSSVTLNRNSKIIVDKNYNSDTRVIKLEGEALFSVIKTTDNKPFVVQTDQGDVQVLGTEFNVKTGNTTQVYVKHGKVALADKLSKNKIQLKKGEKGSINESGKLSKLPGNDNILYWHSNILSFDGERLIDITKEVNERLDTKIIPDQDIRNAKLTISFEGNSEDAFFNELHKVKSVKITQDGNIYRISSVKK